MTDNDQSPIVRPEEEASDDEFRAAMKAAEEAASVPADAPPPTAAEHVAALDSLQANEFAVELDGVPVKGVFRVTGLRTFRLGETDVESAPVIISKMVQRDVTLPFNQWLRETVDAGHGTQRPTRTLAIVAVDDGEETRRWTLTDAYVTEIAYTDFDTSDSQFVEELVTVAYSEILETWTWSDKQT